MIKRISSHLSSKSQQYLRVWRLLKKPTFMEFKTISKVSAVGLIIIGAMGFLISVGIKLLGGFFNFN